MSWTGMDPDRARYVAGRLHSEVANVEALRSSHSQIAGLVQDADLLATLRQLHDEFAAETGALANLLTKTAELVEFADSQWGNHHVMAMMESSLASGFSTLEASMANGIGSTGSAVERSQHGIPDSLLHLEGCGVQPDLGGTYSLEQRLPWFVGGDDPMERGRNAVVRALHDTGNDCQIGVDEFEIIKLENDRYVVVLPGVTDLSSAAEDPIGLFSWNPDHRSVRATWMAARESALSTGIDGNQYAQMVRTAMDNEVPHGSEVMIIGHSFGADTALDLAADPSFNSSDRFVVTHVVAAAYHSGPQLRSVPGTTDVLVLQNSADMVVVAESALDQPSAAIHGATDAWSSAQDYDVDGFTEGTGDALEGAALSVADATRWFGGGGPGDLGMAVTDDAVDHLTGVDVPISDESIVEVFHLEPGVEVNSSQVAVVFEGGTSHAGHHQEHYIDYVDSNDEASVHAFFESIDNAGYTADGSSHAVDVSVPE